MASYFTKASNFPAGFNNVTIRGIPLTQAHPGQTFWVSNATTSVLPGHVGGSDGNPGTFAAPFSTLDYAIGRCVAGRGDIIFVKPGHAESIASATALNLDVKGVAIVGLGFGNSRPAFTFTTANTATIPVSADNIAFINCRFIGNFLGIASAFTLAAAANFTLQDCDFSDTSAILNFLAIVTTTVSTNSDFLYIGNNRVHSIATTRAVAPFVILNTMTGLTVVDNRVTCTVAHNNVSQLVSHAALVMTDLLVKSNYVYCVNTDTATGAVLLSTTATTGSGMVAHNRIYALDIAAAIVVTATAVQYGLFDNLYIGDGTSNSGFVLPAIGTDA